MLSWLNKKRGRGESQSSSGAGSESDVRAQAGNSRPGSPTPVRSPGQDGKRVAVDTEGQGSGSGQAETTAVLGSGDASAASIPADTDVADFAARLGFLVEAEQEFLLHSIQRTPRTPYSYPVTDGGKKSKRQFQPSWVLSHRWMAYSVSKDGVYCTYCVAFHKMSAGVGKGGHQTAGKFVASPATNWKKLLEEAKVHEKSGFHRSCYTDAEFFTRQRKAQTNVRKELDRQRKKADEEEGKNAIKIMKLVALLGRQQMPSRGHRETTNFASDSTSGNMDSNLGNMAALIGHLREVDPDFRKQMNLAPKNATYLGHGIHDEMRDLMGEYIKAQIVKEVNEGPGQGVFGLIADGSQDVQGVEQLCMSLRYTSWDYEAAESEKASSTSTKTKPKLIVRERFLCFIPLEDRSAASISGQLVDQLKSLGLDPSKMVCQCYDGASVNTGHINGIKTKILALYPLAVFVHCSSHSYNLAFQDSVKSITLTTDTVRKAANYFSSSDQRKRILEKIIHQIEVDPSQKSTLVKFCSTRFVQRFEAVERFCECLQAVNLALETLADGSFSSETRAQAEGLLSLIQRFDVLFTLAMLMKIYPAMKIIAKALQSTHIELPKAIHLVGEQVKLFEDLATRSEDGFEDVFKSAKDTAVGLGCNVDIPRGSRNNKNLSIKEYYRRRIWDIYLEDLVKCLKARFSSHQKLAFSLQLLVPSFCIEHPKEELTESLFKYEPLHGQSQSSCQAEVELWHRRWTTAIEQDERLPNTVTEAIECCDKNFMPGIHKALVAVLTMPATSCTAERVFSSMKLIKTPKANRMGNNKLEATTHLASNRDISLDFSVLLEQFKSMKVRRGI